MSRSSLKSYRVFLKDGTDVGRLLIPEWCKLDFKGISCRIADANIDGCLVVEFIDPSGGSGPDYRNLPMREACELFEKGYLTSQFCRFSGNVARIAKFSGVCRVTLWRKMKSLGVIRKTVTEVARKETIAA